MPDPISSSSTRPNDYYDPEGAICNAEPESRADSAPAGRAPSAPPRPTSDGCDVKVAVAGVTCARATLAALELAPTLVGGLVASFLGGVSCGIAVMDASECLSKSKPHAP
jgi:hypothetical protein